MSNSGMDFKSQLTSWIKAQGGVTIAEFMARVIPHYYANNRVFGEQGDFTTAPEISQLFGEMIGIWCVSMWEGMGQPASFQLIELGPGRGTLLSDLLRATSHIPDFKNALSLHLIETSSSLRKLQKEKLPQAQWHESLDTIPKLPSVFIANEFFDALPIEQYVKTEQGVGLRKIHINDEGLYFLPQGEVVKETSPLSIDITKQIASHMKHHGGAALFIDYGYEKGWQDTLQAVKSHRYCGIFEHLVEADITAHVDFAALKSAVQPLKTTLLNQRDFLRGLGIELRAAQLIKHATPAQHRQIAAGLERLIAPDQMGELFKCLIVQTS